MKKVQFNHRFLPYLFIAPQIIIVVIFFLWPSAMAVYYSFQMQDAFGVSMQFVGIDNYRDIFANMEYFHTCVFTLLFSVAVTLFSLSIGLFLAYKVNTILRAKSVYRTLFMWPYALADSVK